MKKLGQERQFRRCFSFTMLTKTWSLFGDQAGKRVPSAESFEGEVVRLLPTKSTVDLGSPVNY